MDNIDNVRRNQPTEVDRLARSLFEIDGAGIQDRTKYALFDAMPPGLQNWWRDRAARKLLERI